MTQIMRRLPVIKGLVTVLYRGIHRSEDVGTEEDIESTNWLDGERRRRSAGTH